MWGAFIAGVKAMFAGESFFLSSYTPNDGQPGEVGLAPTHQGEVRSVKVGSEIWVCSGGSYLGSSGDVDLEEAKKLSKKYFGKIRKGKKKRKRILSSNISVQKIKTAIRIKQIKSIEIN